MTKRRVTAFLVALFFTVVFLDGCSAELNRQHQKGGVCKVLPKESSLKVFPVEQPSGVVILAHGLNNKPEVMDPIAGLLNGENLTAIRLSFRGHTEQSRMGDVDATQWIEDLAFAYCYARENYPGAQLYNLSFSLGSAVTVAFLERFKEARFDKMIFLAPAITPNAWRLPGKFLAIFDFTGLALPSRMPKNYRALSWLPLSAYSALFDITDDIATITEQTKLSAIPTKILMNRDDELISESRLADWISNNKLESWQVKLFRSAPDANSYRHLILDEGSLGIDGWSFLRGEIRDFIGSGSEHK